MSINLSVEKVKWSATLSNLLATQVQHDLQLICANGTVQAHRVVLAQHSDLLRNIITDQSMLTYENGIQVAKVFLVDVERETASELINLFYRGEVTLKSLEQYHAFLTLFKALQIKHVDLLDVSAIAVDDVLEIVCSDEESVDFASDDALPETDPLTTCPASSSIEWIPPTIVPKLEQTSRPPPTPLPPTQRTYPCFCGKSYPKFSLYKDHLFRSHFKRDIEVMCPQIGLCCTECGKEFVKQHQTRRHFFVCHDHILKFVPEHCETIT